MTAEAASTQHQADWSPSAIDPEAGPYEALAALRESCPAPWTDEGHGYWTVTRYADIVAMARDTETFSNVPRHPPIGTMYTPPLEADRPRHTPFRRALNPFFKRDYLTAKEGMVRELAVEMIQPLLEAGTADYSQQLCQPMPAIVLCR
ncbi:hypothetical protein HER39_19305, partial [Arthrobacter deserti]|nr:hypothetical protein [Arthrobacter deserti]